MRFITTKELRRLRNESFERGERHGKDLAIEELRDVQKHRCINLTESEKKMIMDFLKTNNFEFGYNPYLGGFYILKNVNQLNAK